MSALLPPNSTPLERAVASACANDLPVPIRDIWDVDNCPDNLIPWLGWALHVDGWDEAATIEQKRSAIRDAVLLHRKKGTPWALKRALAKLGIDIDIFDQQAQRKIYADLNPNRINGQWSLNGAVKIKPLELQALLPQIQRWAQFIVRVNLGSITRGNLFERLDALINEWKPARSWPIYLFWLAFTFSITIEAHSATLMAKNSRLRYPWCGKVISASDDASWKLGKDGETIKLSQPFGSFKLGERRGHLSAWHIKGCRVTSAMQMQSSASAIVYRLPYLSEKDRRLDGSWRIGGYGLDADSNLLVKTASQINVSVNTDSIDHSRIRMDYPATPARLGGFNKLSSWRRLDGQWRIGDLMISKPFGFKIIRDLGVHVESAALISSADILWPTSERLPANTSPIVGERRLYLNGSWRVGSPAAPVFNLTIIKETSHG